ncbi:MAG: hypothetical protein ACRELB_13810, partial [Polyangiaceae bacterium]
TRIDRSTAPAPPPDDDDASRAHGPPLAARSAPPRDASELPTLPDTSAGLLARAVRAHTSGAAAAVKASTSTASTGPATPTSARPVVAMGIPFDVVLADGRDAAVKRGLDAFREAATPTYHVPGEGDFKVAAAFRMPGCGDERIVKHHQDTDLKAIAASQGVVPSRLHFGRATPDQVRRVTQALIDAGKLPAPSADYPTAPARIRKMMFDYGIGFDCAGYAQQAFLSARGLTRAQAGLASEPVGESLSKLRAPFERVAPDTARPGDVVVLDPPTTSTAGHRAVVFDSRSLSADAVGLLRSRSGAALVVGRVSVLTLDSSWGAGGNPSVGGVGRHSFYYDADSKKWASADGGPVVFSASPYGGDSLRAIYRYPVKP